MNNNIKKNFVWNIIGSTVNSFTSLFFMIIVTRINGIEEAGIFTFSFSFALIAQIIAHYSGRSYQVTNLDESINDSDFIYSKILTCFLMFVFSLIFICLKQYSNLKTTLIVLLIVFRMIESFGEVLYGILQKNDKLYLVGISMFLKGLISVILFLIVDYATKNILLSTISVVVVNLLFLLFYDINNIKKDKIKLEKFNFINIKKILIGGFAVFMFTILTQYVNNAPKFSIDNFLSDEFQTIFGIIVMPATIMGLCSQFLFQPFLTTITECIKKREVKRFINLVVKISVSIFAFGILAEIFCYFFGINILKFLYGIKLNKYKTAFLLIVLGAVFNGISYFLSTCLIAFRKNIIQVVIYLFISIFTFIISNIFVETYGVLGASISYFLTMSLLLLIYFIYFCYYIYTLKKED